MTTGIIYYNLGQNSLTILEVGGAKIKSLTPINCRILDLTTPLYLGGVESRVSLFSPLSSVSFNGCISNLKLNQYLFDLNNPLRGEGTQPGCPPLSPERSCVQISCMRDCVDMWNGGRCIRESTRQGKHRVVHS